MFCDYHIGGDDDGYDDGDDDVDDNAGDDKYKYDSSPASAKASWCCLPPSGQGQPFRGRG